ncbi:hypothetical protein [Halomonas sp. SpR8]|uniref:hypothetical protein n=1 Tax=Halomonas sp. SpR8 TaxID=3050463 RepID=UPI0027E474F1|nr:hypothetical protein [Halomonas sp. SpR8]MDQ7727223.1 hypothetical protein [Halomonas sp. SpR8]
MAAPFSRRHRSKGIYREWTLIEMELIKRHHSEMTFKELQAQHLPHRTIGALKRMSYLLGLKKLEYDREYGQPRWTEEELRIIAKHFLLLKTSEIRQRFLPHRSKLAIRQATRKLGLRVFNAVPWTEEELAILRHEFPLGGPKRVNQRLPHRTVDAIKLRSRVEGLVYVPHGDGESGDLWSAEELDLLKANCGLPAAELAKLFPHREKKAVINKRYKLQWNPVKFWSEGEVERMCQHLDASVDELCVLFPNRPREGVRLKRDKLRRKQAQMQKPNTRKA